MNVQVHLYRKKQPVKLSQSYGLIKYYFILSCTSRIRAPAAFSGMAALGPGRVKTEKSGPTQEPLPSAAR